MCCRMLYVAAAGVLLAGGTAALPMQPCADMEQVIKFPDVRFDREAPLVFGGGFYAKAAVTFNSLTPSAPIFDLGNGLAMDNVVLGLHYTKYLMLQVYRGDVQQMVVCKDEVPLTTPVTVEAVITPDTGSNVDGVGAIYINGRLCVRNPLHLPVWLFRSSHRLGEARTLGIVLDGKVHSLDISSCLPPVQPCPNMEQVAKFHDGQTFNQEAPLTFGGGFYAKATVTFNSLTQSGLIFDFGNGFAKDNVILGLQGIQARFVLEVFRGNVHQRLVCNSHPPLNTALTVEAIITPDTGSNVDGVGAIFVDGVACAWNPLHQPVAVTRTSNLIGIRRSKWEPNSIIDGKVHTLDISSCALSMQPCPSMEQVAKFHDVATFDQEAPLIFGGGFYAKATVTFNRHTLWARIFDFGNGASKDNVVLGLHANTKHLVLEVFRGNVPQMLVCEDEVPLNNEDHGFITVEAIITPDTDRSNVDGVGAIYIDGRLCNRKSLHLPAAVTRTSNLIGTSNWDRNSIIDGKVHSLDISSCPLSMRPCDYMQNILSTHFQSLLLFNQEAPLTFGGGFYAVARVTFNRHTSWGRIFDFGNGASKDNVILGLHANTNHLMLEVFRGDVNQMVVCEDEVPLDTAVTVEAIITPFTGSDVDGVGAIYIDGRLCIGKPLHQPAAVTRTSNLIGTSSWDNTSIIDAKLHYLDIYSCALPEPRPCLSFGFHGVAYFREAGMSWGLDRPSLFGGGFYAKARVTFDSLRPSARIFDFGNGASKDNVILGLLANTNHLMLQVFRGDVQQMVVCKDEVPLNTAVTVEAVITPDIQSNVDGVGAIYIDGRLCIGNPLHLPVRVTRTSNLLGTSNSDPTSLWDPTSVHSLDMRACLLPSRQPCPNMKDVVSFYGGTFDQEAPLTFGGGFYAKATVTFNSLTQSGPIFDFGNGASKDNVILGLHPDTKHLVLEVFRGNVHQMLVCEDEVPLYLDVEVIITPDTGSNVDGVGAIYIDGGACIGKPLHQPAAVTRTSNLIGTSRSDHTSGIDGKVKKLVISTCTVPMGW